VARTSRRPALAAAFVGWNPVLAIHAAGGGHNDALVGALVAAAVALGAHRRASLGGSVWALATLVKWVPVVFLVVGGIATWCYGLDWLGALGPLTDNAARETSYALPSRLEQLGLPEDAALGVALGGLSLGLAWLASEALRGQARLGRAACLMLATTPYLVVWYLAWAVPLAAPEDDDRIARFGALALTAYLLPQTIPL
jgi:hypothetical protein